MTFFLYPAAPRKSSPRCQNTIIIVFFGKRCDIYIPEFSILKNQLKIFLVILIFFFTSSCANFQQASSFPKAHSGMDVSEDRNFIMPEEKEEFNDKAAKVILGIALVGACVAAAVVIPLVAINKFD